MRIDGRDTRTVRPIVAEVGILPRAHGSGLFTRGDTQALSVATLGPVTATNIVLVDNQGFAIAGNVSVGASGKVDLSTINGSITQVTGGTLNAGTLTSGGGIATALVLDSTNNAIGTIVGITTNGLPVAA